MSEDRNSVEVLSAWLERESPTGDAQAVNAMMDLVVRDVEQEAIAVERIPGQHGLGDVLVLRAGPAVDATSVLVISHLDTVHPLGTAERDLPIRIDGDRLYGPGAYDMKGGVYLALQAFKDLARRRSASRPLVFFISPDEEVGSPSTRGIITDLARSAHCALVVEPARGPGSVVTARKGVGWFEVDIKGRPAHAGTNHRDGRSAIREAARQILHIEAMTDYDRGATTSVGVIAGGTAQNVVPQQCRFSVDLRVATAADGAVYENAMRGLRPENPEIELSVTGGMNRPPYERTAAVGRLYERAREIARGVGIELNEVPMVGGGSDGNITAALGVPTLDGLGIEGAGAHTLAEYGLISSIEPRRRLMAALLESL